MDTLCLDLQRLNHSFLKASDAVLFGVDIGNNEEILDMFGSLAKFKIALQTHNYYWINELIDTIHDTKAVKWALKYGCHGVGKYLIETHDNFNKFSTEYIGCLFYYGYYDLVRSETERHEVQIDETYLSYYYYLCGRNKIVPDLNNTSLIQRREFVRGLSRGQHKELFKQYYNEHTNIIFLLLNFDDEDYAISLLDPNVGKFQNIIYDIDKAINRNRFKVARFLFQSCEPKKRTLFQETSGSILVAKSKLDLFDDIGYGARLDKSKLENYIYVACLKSDIRTLQLIFNKFKDKLKDEYLYLLAKHCLSFDVYDYYVQLLDGSENLIVLDDDKKKLIPLVDQLRPYIPDHLLSVGTIPTIYELIRNMVLYYSGRRGKFSLKIIRIIINILYNNELSVDRIIEILESTSGSYIICNYDNFYSNFISLAKHDQIKLIKSMIVN